MAILISMANLYTDAIDHTQDVLSQKEPICSKRAFSLYFIVG